MVALDDTEILNILIERVDSQHQEVGAENRNI